MQAASATAAYYAALHRHDGAGGYSLLCAQQQALFGQREYVADVATNDSTGTGIASWQQGSAAQVQDTTAAVAGKVTLDNGGVYPLTVDLVLETGHWRVCGSSLGGVLPGAGDGSGEGGGGVTTT